MKHALAGILFVAATLVAAPALAETAARSISVSGAPRQPLIINNDPANLHFTATANVTFDLVE